MSSFVFEAIVFQNMTQSTHAEVQKLANEYPSQLAAAASLFITIKKLLTEWCCKRTGLPVSSRGNRSGLHARCEIILPECSVNYRCSGRAPWIQMSHWLWMSSRLGVWIRCRDRLITSLMVHSMSRCINIIKRNHLSFLRQQMAGFTEASMCRVGVKQKL